MNEQTDVAVGTGPASDDGPNRFRRGRLLRWAAVVVIGVVALLALWQDPLYARQF